MALTTRPSARTASPPVKAAPSARHVLLRPGQCQCGSCIGWTRRRGRKRPQPVTLLDAMKREDRADWPSMVGAHITLLTELAADAASAIAAGRARDPLAKANLGLPVLTCAGELADVLQLGPCRDQLTAEIIAVGDAAIVMATAIAARCLKNTAAAFEAMAELSI